MLRITSLPRGSRQPVALRELVKPASVVKGTLPSVLPEVLVASRVGRRVVYQMSQAARPTGVWSLTGTASLHIDRMRSSSLQACNGSRKPMRTLYPVMPRHAEGSAVAARTCALA